MSPSISLDELQTIYPDGFHSKQHGCYYFLDYDGEAGYFIELRNGEFENDTNYVELDTMGEDDRREVEKELAYLG